jgi:glucokinase
MAAELTAIARDGLSAEEPDTPARKRLMPPRLAVGIALPGTVDAQEGVARWLHTSGNWFNVPLRSLVGAALDVPVVVDRRAYTSTLAELRFGAARGVDQVCCLYMGDGIGMGVGAGGRILRGAGDQVGTIAHIQVVSEESDAPVCHCGMRGCLWAVASVPAILRRVSRAVQEGALSRVASSSGAAPALSDVIDAARKGDRLCADALRVAALATARAIAACVHVLNPQVVLIGGPLSEAADLLGPLLTGELERRIFPWLDPKPELRFSALGPFAAARGAAALASDLLLGLSGEGP